MLTLSIGVLCILFLIGAPIFLVFSVGGLMILLYVVGFPLNQLTNMFFASLNSYVLLAGPLFILAGNLLLHGGLSTPMARFVDSFTNRIPGGVAVATIIASTFAGALIGAITATLAAVGIVMFPMMREARYSKGYSAAILCSSCNLGVLIPPSIVFILFGYLTDTHVTELFIAGVLPGLAMAALLSIAAIIVARRKHFPLMPSVTWRERGQLFIRALSALIMPFIILGGIYGGIFTPTEAAAVACVYAIIVGALVYRKLNWRNLWASFSDTTRLMGMVFLMVAAGTFLGKAFTLIGFPQAISNWIIDIGLGPTGFLVMISIVFLALGCIMDGFAIMFVILPLIMPVTAQLDINMLQLAVIFCISICIAGVTPPIALTLYITSGMFDTPVEDTIQEVFPFLAAMIIALVIAIFFPEISFWLPGKML
jgi:C4-dicarboxylate transporter DctM subunit